jgi:hypothetical protein
MVCVMESVIITYLTRNPEETIRYPIYYVYHISISIETLPVLILSQQFQF